MNIHLLRHTAVVMATVLLCVAFSACSKGDDGPNTKPKPVAVTGVTLNKTTTSILIGGAETITATITPKDAANKQVSWTSSDATIATVDTTGKVTGVKNGTTVITATTAEGNKTATCTVTVTLAKDNINMEGFEDKEW